jgi:hypothetical protein
MEPIQAAAMLTHSAGREVAFSALPDAPVVAPVDHPAAVRAAFARALRQLADVVSPPSRGSAPAPSGRLMLTAGNGSWAATWDESHCRPSRSMSA